MSLAKSLWILTLLILLAGCASPKACYDTAASGDALHSIYVVRRARHTGIIVRAADWPTPSFLKDDFPKADYLEFGWGDAAYYQAEEETLWLGLRAAFWPSPSVVHVIGLTAPLDKNARADDIVEVRISQSGLLELIAAINTEFAAQTPIGRELQSTPRPNRFYSAHRGFFFPHMCNWWTADRLKDAGCPITPWTVVTASRVLREARGFEEASPAHRSALNREAAPRATRVLVATH
jgi:uncharacterized protein (TIGR02117 family)